MLNILMNRFSKKLYKRETNILNIQKNMILQIFNNWKQD